MIKTAEQLTTVRRKILNLYESNAQFRAAASVDAAPFLKQEGFAFEHPNVKVRIHCNSARTMHIVLPSLSGDKLPDAALADLHGGATSTVATVLPSTAGSLGSFRMGW